MLLLWVLNIWLVNTLRTQQQVRYSHGSAKLEIILLLSKDYVIWVWNISLGHFQVNMKFGIFRVFSSRCIPTVQCTFRACILFLDTSFLDILSPSYPRYLINELLELWQTYLSHQQSKCWVRRSESLVLTKEGQIRLMWIHMHIPTYTF